MSRAVAMLVRGAPTQATYSTLMNHTGVEVQRKCRHQIADSWSLTPSSAKLCNALVSLQPANMTRPALQVRL